MRQLCFTAILQLFLFLQTPLCFSQSLSYGEAREMMQQNNKKLQSLSKQEQAAEYAQKQASALRFPNFSLSGKAVHLNDDLGINLNSKRDQMAQLLKLPTAEILGDWQYILQKQNFWSIDLDMKYPVFTGGKINAAVEATNLKSKIKNKEIAKQQNALLTELSTRYFQLQLAGEVAKLRQQALEATQKHYENATKLEKNGMIAAVERMQAETAVADAKRELLAAQKNAVLAKTALEGTLGINALAQEALTTPLFLSDKLLPLQHYEKEASLHFPDIEKLFLLQELAVQNMKVKKSAYIPDVALMGKYHILSENLPITDPDWYLGVGFSFTLFDGMKRKNELRESRAALESVKLMKEQALQDIKILVRKHYQELEKHMELATSLEKDIAFAEELLRVREKSFIEGFGTSVDVVDATLYLSGMKLKRLKALCEYDVTLASLLEISGESAQFENYIRK